MRRHPNPLVLGSASRRSSVRRGCVTVLLIFWLGRSALVSAAAAQDLEVVAYLPNWIDMQECVDRTDLTALSHLIVAFKNPPDATGRLPADPADAKVQAAAHRHGVKVLMSIGGGWHSRNAEMRSRYFELIKPDRVKAFAQSLADDLVEQGFDGLDVNLEGPAINEDYDGFISALAHELGSRRKLLSAALPTGGPSDRIGDETLKRFDFINAMAYDLRGPWEPEKPGPHAPMFFAVKTLDYWARRGVPAPRVMLGIPFYGYGFGEDFREGEYPYHEILGRFPLALRQDRVGSTLFLHGPASVAAKTRLALDRQLGGVMIWSIDSDAAGADSLLRVIQRERVKHLGPTTIP